MYQAFELINTYEEIFTYVFIKDTLNPLVLDTGKRQAYEQTFLKYLDDGDVALIINGYNLLKDDMSDYGPKYIRINTQEELNSLSEELGI